MKLYNWEYLLGTKFYNNLLLLLNFIIFIITSRKILKPFLNIVTSNKKQHVKQQKKKGS